MILENLPAGNDVPNDFNVVIEISMNSPGIKYEIDKDSGAITVDRFMSTAMHYPCNYGFVPHTLSDDGDPVDVLVISPYPLPPGVVVRCRPVGMLAMDDEAGGDAKILAVPINKLTPLYKNVRGMDDLPVGIANQIAHFFAHYKDLEEGKWVKVLGWRGVAEAEQELMGGIARFQKVEDKPQF